MSESAESSMRKLSSDDPIFDDIRPCRDDEIKTELAKICSDKSVLDGILRFRYPILSKWCGLVLRPFVRRYIKNYCDKINNIADFQDKVAAYMRHMIDATTDGVTFKGFDKLDPKRGYLFISNHRDISLDPAFIDLALHDAGFDTVRIAIGDNLLSLPWVKDLVRVNKAFIVERALSMRQMLMSSKRLSDYMHFAIKEKNENIWIAQREGRAKDSNDRTQKSILQMMSMGGEGSIIDRLKQLHLVPLSISYEYDPCDFLKAKEFQQKRDNADWKKGPMDDLVSMQTGIFGYKGHVHYHAAPCLDDYLDSLDPDMPKQDIYNKVAAYMDEQIFKNYRLYPGNYVALDLLENSTAHQAEYTAEDKAKFEKYMAGQLAKIDLPNKDEAYLKEKFLEMYANPVRNYLAAQ